MSQGRERWRGAVVTGAASVHSSLTFNRNQTKAVGSRFFEITAELRELILWKAYLSDFEGESFVLALISSQAQCGI